jgi:hypothetical protein
MADEIIPNWCYNINQNDTRAKDFGNDTMSVRGWDSCDYWYHEMKKIKI